MMPICQSANGLRTHTEITDSKTLHCQIRCKTVRINQAIRVVRVKKLRVRGSTVRVRDRITVSVSVIK